MSTPKAPPLRPSPLMFREFQKLRENRRRLSSLTKPKISKLRGTGVWMCRLLPQQHWQPLFGTGLTPALAYKDWKSKMGLWC